MTLQLAKGALLFFKKKKEVSFFLIQTESPQVLTLEHCKQDFQTEIF